MYMYIRYMSIAISFVPQMPNEQTKWKAFIIFLLFKMNHWSLSLNDRRSKEEKQKTLT